MSTWIEVITDALVEIGVYDIGESISPEHLTWCVSRANRIIDSWAARKIYAYNVDFLEFTLTANHQPHLIGPGLVAPDFNAPRPVRLENAALILTNSDPVVDIPLNLRDDDWWANKRVKNLKSSIPTDLYYSPSNPNGSLFLWPVPNTAYGLRLEAWVSLGLITDPTAQFVAPYGYELAFMLTLAEEACGPMARTLPADLVGKAVRARTAIQRNNDLSPRITTSEPGTRPASVGDFNWLVGGPA
jgi:hypothetical protein